MGFISKMSNKIKVLILVIYTLIVLFLALLIVFLTYNTKEFKKYLEIPEDENIELTVRLMENRYSSNRTNRDYESSEYSLYAVVKRKEAIKNCAIEYLNFYFAFENSKGEIIYADRTSNYTISASSSSGVGAYSVISGSTISKEITKSEDELVKKDNEPVTVYIRVAYNVRGNGVDKKNNSLDYKFNLANIEKISFDSFSKREILKGTTQNGYAKNEDEIFNVLLRKRLTDESSSSGNIKNDIIRGQVLLNSAKLGTNKIKNLSIEMFGRVKNDRTDVDNFFEDYIRVFNYYGMLSSYSIAAADLNYDEKYEMDRIYIYSNILYDNGKSETVSFYVDVNDLINY